MKFNFPYADNPILLLDVMLHHVLAHWEGKKLEETV